MTPQLIRARLIKARQDELRRIIAEIQATRPVNAAELIDCCRQVQAGIAADVRRLQAERDAGERR